MTKHHTYQIEGWKRGEIIFRSEVSDDIEETRRNAQDLYDALGIMYTVFILVDGANQYSQYGWASL